MSTSNVNTVNNSVVEPFDWDKYEGNQQDKAEAKVSNLEDEINFYKKRIKLKKNDIKKLERNLRVAERKLKRAQEAQRAEKIKALLEANKGRKVIVEWSTFIDESDKTSSALAEEIEVTISLSNNSVIGCPKQHWAGVLEIVSRIYVEAEL